MSKWLLVLFDSALSEGAVTSGQIKQRQTANAITRRTGPFGSALFCVTAP